MSTPLQLLYASPTDGEDEHGRVTTAPLEPTLNGLVRPRDLDVDGAHFVALTLGVQDLVRLASELSRISDLYLVEVDVRDRTMREPAGAGELEEAFLSDLKSGRADQVVNYLSAPSSDLRMWALGLSSPTSNGKLVISRDGTLIFTADDPEVLALVLRTLQDVLTGD